MLSGEKDAEEEEEEDNEDGEVVEVAPEEVMGVEIRRSLPRPLIPLLLFL